MLRNALLYALGKPELQSFWVKLWHKLNDIENPNIRHSNDIRRCKALIRPLRNDFVGFGSGHTKSQLASGIWSTPLVEGIAQFENVATRVRAVHTQSLREFFDRGEFVACQELH